MRASAGLLRVLITISTSGCGISLSTTLPRMNLAAAPWSAPAPDLAITIIPSQEQCFKRIESLRNDALSALKAREARRVAVAVSTGVLEAAGIALSATSTSSTDGKAISGYIVTGVGAVAHIIDAIVPDTKAEALYAAWRKASDYYEAAEQRLSMIQVCVAVDKPEEKAACRGLDAAIKIQGQGAVGAVEDEQTAAEKVRSRFLAIHGDDAIAAVKDAYTRCAHVDAKDFSQKQR